MRNFYQIKTVASAPPRRLIPIGKVISATGLVLVIVSLISALSSSANIYGSLSFLFLLFGLFFFVDGLLLVITASKQQEKLLGLRQSLLEDDPQIVASAEEFMAQRKSLTQQGEITGIFIVHNATKDLYYVGQSAKAIDRAAYSFSVGAIAMCMPTTSTATHSACALSRCQKAATKVSMSSNAQRYKRSRLLARSHIEDEC